MSGTKVHRGQSPAPLDTVTDSRLHGWMQEEKQNKAYQLGSHDNRRPWDLCVLLMLGTLLRNYQSGW